MRREVRATANRLANFDDANLRRRPAPRCRRRTVERALRSWATRCEHLRYAGRLRSTQAGLLEELGQLADPS